MPPREDPSQITLKIKVPPGFVSSPNSEQFDIGTVQVTSTIGALRQQICQLVPTHPAPEKQRLLYGGRALVDNDQSIGDALNVKRDPSQGEYVIHLLVKGEEGQSRTSTPGSGHRVQVQPSASRTAGAEGNSVTPGHAPQPAQHVPLNHQQQHHLLNLQQQQFHRQLHEQALQQLARGGIPQLPPQFVHGGPNAQMAGWGMQPMPQEQQAGGEDGQAAANATQNHAQGEESQGQQPGQQPNINSPLYRQQLQAQQMQQQQQRRGQQGFHIEGIGPNGQHFQIHQQTLNLPGMPGGPQMGFPMMPMHPHVPAIPPQPREGPTALEQARENINEMRSMLDELANQSEGMDEARRQRIEEVQRRARSVGEYIDPFHLGSGAAAAQAPPASGANGRRSAPPLPRPQQHQQAQNAALGGGRGGLRGTPFDLGYPPPVPGPAAFPLAFPPGYGAPQQPNGIFQPAMRQQNAAAGANASGEVTAYLLSSRQGPQALLFSPQHGTYTGTLPALHPTPTSTSTTQHPPPAQPPAQPPQPPDAAIQQQPPQDPAADALQPLLAHFWLLLRILIFAYFLLGANMGWQRPLILAGIGLAFWLLRLGVLGDLLGERGAVRAWWEGVVGAPAAGAGAVRAAGQEAAGAVGQNQRAGDQANGAVATGNDANANANANANGGQVRQRNAAARMPTPEQVAQRLLNEAEQQRGNWLRERLRPLERAVALFVASLWPGIGEGYVREQRRVREEEEVATRRREEEASVANEERERERGERIADGSWEKDVTAESVEAEKVEERKEVGEVDGGEGSGSARQGEGRE